MMVLFLILFLILFCFFSFITYYCFKFRNPYRLFMVFGKKGSGKTTYMTKLAYRYYKKGFNVYCNIKLPFGTLFDPTKLGIITPPPKSVLLIDEVGMIWDNRQYSKFPINVRDYFKLQRHYNHVVYLFSQSFDIDIKLRTLTDAMYLITAPFPFLSCVRRIKRSITLVQPTADTEGRIADSLEFVPLLLCLFGVDSLSFTWIPRWTKYFDSFEVPHTIYIPENKKTSCKNVTSVVRYIYNKKSFLFKRRNQKND